MEATHPEKGPWAAELVVGDHLIGFFMAQRARLEPFRDPTRGSFLSLSLGDRSGEIDARIWEETETYTYLLEGPQVLKVEGEVERYQDRPQVRILRLRTAEAHEYELMDLQPSTLRDRELMMAELDAAIASVENTHLRALLQSFFEQADFRHQFASAPAAKRIHHAYLGGLLEHVYEILLLSKPLLVLYPDLNADLLTTGILLHDIGKLEEFSWQLTIDYTPRGRLIGHVVLGAELVARAVDSLEGFPPELALELQHLLLSHHGRYEWGAPRRPKTLVAVALHHLEQLDGQVNRFRALLAPAWESGQAWTDYDRLLGRTLYAGGAQDLSIEEEGFSE